MIIRTSSVIIGLMQELNNAHKKNALHHAYLLEGSESVKDEVIQFVEQGFKLNVRGNPDVHIREYNSFGIDAGR